MSDLSLGITSGLTAAFLSAVSYLVSRHHGIQQRAVGRKGTALRFPDKMTRQKSCRHKERWGATFPMWVRVFNLHFPDTMTRQKSRRHSEIPAKKLMD